MRLLRAFSDPLESRCRIRYIVLVTLCVGIGDFAVLCQVQPTSGASTTPATCIEKLFDVSTTNNTPAALYATTGCFTNVTLPSAVYNDTIVSTDEFRGDMFNSKKLRGCSANCSSRVPTVSTVPFFIEPARGACVCWSPYIEVNATNAVTMPCFNATTVRESEDKLNASLIVLYTLQLYCVPQPTASGECGTGCAKDADFGCCRPPLAPAESLWGWELKYALIMFVVISIIAIVVEFVIAPKCRNGLGVAQVSPRRNNSDGRLLRDEHEAESLSDALMFGINVSQSSAADVASAPTTCPVCLDRLDSVGCAILPCNHQMHFYCLRDYLKHCLRRYAELTCPVCREPILTDVRNTPRLAVPSSA